jgi:iron complex transport system permease protein
MKTVSIKHKQAQISRTTPRRTVYRQLLLWSTGLSLLLIAVVILACAVGPVQIDFGVTAAIILESVGLDTGVTYTERDLLIVRDLRLPRVLVGALVGAALAVSGAVMQALFRNPLAEPGIIGVSSGAAVGATFAFYFQWVALSPWALPLAAFIGSLLAISVVYLVASFGRHTSMATLLLVGIGVNAFMGAITSVLVANAPDEQQLRGIIFWLQGGLEARTWEHVELVVLPILLGCLFVAVFGRDLNVMLLGDEGARNAGVDVPRVRMLLLGTASLLAGVAVSVSGIIGFVGLIIPHVVRLVIGPDHRC